MEEIVNLIKEKEELTSKLDFINSELKNYERKAVSIAHIEYFKKYGQWDWQVRSEFMKRIKEKAMDFDSYRFGGIGHPFEIFNFIPINAFDANIENWLASSPKKVKKESVTEFIHTKDYNEILPDIKTKEAFRIQKDYYLSEEENYGLRYNSEPIDFSDWDGEYDTNILLLNI